MKRVIFTAVFAAFASSALAESNSINGCEVIQIQRSNAYYRADANCKLDNSLASASVRVVTKVKPVLVNVVEPEDTLNPVDVEQPQDTGPSDAGEPEIEETNFGNDEDNGNDASGAETSDGGQGGGIEPDACVDGDNGHGNDVGGADSSDGSQGGGTGADAGDDGHGNDAGGVDASNPGQGGGKAGSDKSDAKSKGKS